MGVPRNREHLLYMYACLGVCLCVKWTQHHELEIPQAQPEEWDLEDENREEEDNSATSCFISWLACGSSSFCSFSFANQAN